MSNKNKALLTPFAECRTMRVTAAATQVHVKAVLQEADLHSVHLAWWRFCITDQKLLTRVP